MTRVRGRRGRLVHAVSYGIRRDLAPEEIPTLVCGRRLRAAVIVVDEYVTCPVCEEILSNGN